MAYLALKIKQRLLDETNCHSLSLVARFSTVLSSLRKKSGQTGMSDRIFLKLILDGETGLESKKDVIQITI